MELMLSGTALTFLLLVGLLLLGAFVDFLAQSSSPHRVYFGDAFAPEPRPTHIAGFGPEFAAEYARAA